MRQKKLSHVAQTFVDDVRLLEERLFADQLDSEDASRMKSDRYSWHYRPSHHIASGLLTKEEIDLLSQPGKRFLSIGAFPGFFERVLCELGVPAENIFLADADPAIMNVESDMQTVVFDATTTWPEMGTFDRIIFPESLCICMSDLLKDKKDPAVPFATDALEAELLAGMIGQALQRLRPGGEIRANGPMSHPNVVKAMSEQLREQGQEHGVEYQRFLLKVHL